MDTQFLLDKLKSTSWWQVTKSLPFEGGGSSTRVVYMTTAFTVLACMFLATVAFAWVYIKDPQHAASVVVAGLVGTLATGATAFAANSQNLRHTLAAQAGTGVTTVADTPLTNEAVSADGETH